MINRLTTGSLDPRSLYEGIEDLARFPDRVALHKYREQLLAKTVEQAAFVRRQCPILPTVVEPCCGNGRLLVALAGEAERLIGFDIAASRVAFARQWVEDLGLPNVHVYQDDLVAPSFRIPSGEADLLICITGAFGYFDALSPGSDYLVVDRFAQVLRPGGVLVLELYGQTLVVERCRDDPLSTYRTWHESAPEDPFQFYLSRFHLERDGQVLVHSKTFVGRDGRIDQGRIEALRLYDLDEIRGLLDGAFDQVKFYRSWRNEPYREGDETLIVVARRCH